MFGIDNTMLVFGGLAGLSAGAVAYAFLFNRIDNEKKAERRFQTVRAAETDRSVVKAARDRMNEAAKRRKTVQDSLKELEQKQKTQGSYLKKPPIKIQIRQAGLSVTPQRFYLYSGTCGVLLALAATIAGSPLLVTLGALIVGALGQVVMAVLLLFVGPEAALWALLLIAVVVGVPQGIVNLAIQNTLYHQADPTRMGATSGLLRTFMYLGAMLASAATGAFFHTSANTAGLHELAWFMLGAAVVFLMITLVDRSLRRVDQLATGHED